MTLRLSDAELVEVSGGYTQTSRQLEALRAAGFWRARLDDDGKVILDRSHYLAVCAGAIGPVRRKPRKEKQPRKRERTPEFRALVTMHANNRRAAKMQRTPAWVDQGALIELYRQAQALTEATGSPHHVDHIVPLRGRTVSGLHVPWNLRVVPASKNLRKYNKHDADADL